MLYLGKGVPLENQYFFQDSFTQFATLIVNVHHIIWYFATGIAVFVCWLLVIIVWEFKLEKYVTLKTKVRKNQINIISIDSFRIRSFIRLFSLLFAEKIEKKYPQLAWLYPWLDSNIKPEDFKEDYAKYKIETSMKFNHGELIEFLWLLAPCFILVLIAIPSFCILLSLKVEYDPFQHIKVIGNQWYWTYEVPVDKYHFYWTKHSRNEYWGISPLTNIFELGLLPYNRMFVLDLRDFFKEYETLYNNIDDRRLFLENRNLVETAYYEKTIFDTVRYSLQGAYGGEMFSDKFEYIKEYRNAVLTLVPYESPTLTGPYVPLVFENSLCHNSESVACLSEIIKIFYNSSTSTEHGDIIFENVDVWGIGYEKNVVNTSFDSYMVHEDDLAFGDYRLLEVDYPLDIRARKMYRVLITSNDVLHSWAIPSLGIKMDAVPGRLNQLYLYVLSSGMYYGQCSELCGINHGFMPIVVRVSDESIRFIPYSDFSFLVFMPDWLNTDKELSYVSENEWRNGTGFVSKEEMVIFAKMQENANSEYLSEYNRWLKAEAWSDYNTVYGGMKPFFI